MKLPIIRPILLTVLRILSWCIFLLTIVAAYSGRISPGISTLPAVLILVFPYLAILTIFLTIFWACYTRFFTTGLGVVTILIILDPLSNVLPIKFPKKEKPEETTFTLTTFNVRHFTDLRQDDPLRNRSAEYILETKSDLVCFQELVDIDDKKEVRMPAQLLDSLKTLYPWRITSKGDELKLFSRYPAELQYIYPYEKGSFNPYEFYTVKIKGHKVNIVNVHLMSYFLSPEERNVVTDIHSVKSARHSINEFKGTILDKLGRSFRTRALQAKQLRELLNRIPDPVIICGDFNDVPESRTYRLIKDDDFKDAYSETGFGHIITFNKHLFLFHIDQILYRGPIKALSVTKGKVNSSDHYPLTVKFAFTEEDNKPYKTDKQ